jgi:hypothetical protein
LSQQFLRSQCGTLGLPPNLALILGNTAPTQVTNQALLAWQEKGVLVN